MSKLVCGHIVRGGFVDYQLTTADRFDLKDILKQWIEWRLIMSRQNGPQFNNTSYRL
jgi:hypothetical protein